MTTLGTLHLESPLLMAPIAGFTDSPFRRIVRRHGAGITYTELISAEGIVRGCRKTMELMHFSAEERPLGIQIFGMDADRMAQAAELVCELGPDLIDINMGCCAPKVCHSGSGAALLRDLDLLGEIATAVVKRAHIPVSAKIRLGWDDDSRNYRETLRVLEGSGISFVTVHGRTRSQRYSGRADWEAIAEIRALASIPVIGNGDIVSHDQALHRLAESGCAAVMIGRGALGNPWIFSGRQPSMAERAAVIRAHIDLMVERFGNYGLILMRKHLVRYVHGVKNASRIRDTLVHLDTYADIIAVIDSLGEITEHAEDATAWNAPLDFKMEEFE
ncbi:MAG: tRNA dihydrouridine synthase DusB [Spirochaetes bacterium]|nr:MAG: tRNA dihydrouridine synthase DusB [Spirochaetota bacterium]